MKNITLSFLVVLIATACAQRLQPRISPGSNAADKSLETAPLSTGQPGADLAAVKNIQKADPKPEPISARPDSPKESDAKQILDDEAKRAGEAPKEPIAPVTIKDPATKPPVVAVPGPSSELPSNCAVDFNPIPEPEGARIMARLAGTWADEKIALTLGAKNDQISFLHVTRNEAGAITSTEKKAQAVSYAVSEDVRGYRLLSIMATGTTGEKISCSVLGLRLEPANGQTKARLHLIPPPKKATSPESFITEGKASGRILKIETL